jgi:hypothetical protein
MTKPRGNLLDILLGFGALGLITFKEDPLKLYKIELASELVKRFLNGKLVKLMFFFPEIYIETEQIACAKNDQATRKSPGNVLWFRALSLLMSKEDPLKLYKIEYASELVKWFVNGKLVKLMVFFRNLYRERTTCLCNK